MKLTQAQLIESVRLMSGKSVEVVEDEAASEYNAETLLTSVDETRGKILRPKIEEEMKEELSRSIDGRRGGELRNYLIKETGIPRKEIEKIEKDQDAIKAAIAYSKNLIEGDTKEVKTKFDEIIAQHNAEKELLKTEYEGKVTAERNIRIERDALDYIQTHILKDIPLPEEADRLVIAKDYYNSLKNDFMPQYDETGKKLDLFQKEKPSFPAMKEGTTQPIDLKEHATGFLSVRGMVKKDMRDVNPAAAMQNAQTQNYQPSGIPVQNGDVAGATMDTVKTYLASQGLK